MDFAGNEKLIHDAAYGRLRLAEQRPEMPVEEVAKRASITALIFAYARKELRASELSIIEQTEQVTKLADKIIGL